MTPLTPGYIGLYRIRILPTASGWRASVVSRTVPGSAQLAANLDAIFEVEDPSEDGRRQALARAYAWCDDHERVCTEAQLRAEGQVVTYRPSLRFPPPPPPQPERGGE